VPRLYVRRLRRSLNPLTLICACQTRPRLKSFTMANFLWLPGQQM
jgi:hypothetical protein